MFRSAMVMALQNTSKFIVPTKGGFKLHVFAKPGAKHSNIVAFEDGVIAVQIAAPPREGAANEELVDFMSKILDIKPSKITLEAGGKSRNKILCVATDLGADQIHQKLISSLPEPKNET